MFTIPAIVATKSSSNGMCEISFTPGKVACIVKQDWAKPQLAIINCTEEMTSFISIIKEDLTNNSTYDDDAILLTGHWKF